jgi:hypothetical protein
MNYRKIFTGIAAFIAVTITLLSFFSGDPWQTMAGFWMLMWVMDANDTDTEISILEKRIQALESKPTKKLFKD